MTDKCPECGVEGRRLQGAKNFLDVLGPNGRYPHIHGGLICVQHQLAQRDKQFAAAQAENKRLRAIVDKLPKDATGNPCLPGDERYHADFPGRMGIVRIRDWEDDDAGVEFYFHQANCWEYRPVGECWPSPEAAEAAKAEGG